MTEQSNDDLIAEARVIWEADNLYPDQMIPRLVMALEAAEQRADQAEATAEHLHDEDTREIVALTQERDAALAVIEKALAVANDSDQGDSFLPTIVALESAPADALREHDAALIEGLADEYADSGREQTHGVTSVLSFLYTKARQRREEQS